MDLALRGKVALVAAASRGIGRAIADELAAEGVSLVLCARGEESLRAARDAIAAASGARVLAVPADVGVPTQVAELVDHGLREFGRIDILVTNSGGPPSGDFDHLVPEMFDDAYRLLLGSVVHLTRALLPGMKQRGWGRIINIASIAAKQPVDGLMLSNSLRAAVIGFARTLANEVAPFGITVNNILPGYTRTERVDELAESTARREGTTAEAVRRRWEEQIPMRRLGEPREIAALAAFLASDRASYVTAGSIAADGGWIRALM